MTNSDKIFEKFHRVDRSDAAADYGHGLGCTFAAAWSKRKRAKIWVESVFGEGSTFSVLTADGRTQRTRIGRRGETPE